MAFESHPEVFMCHVETPEGPADVLTFVPPNVLFKHGLPSHAIIGGLSRPLEPGEDITPEVFARNYMFVEFLHEFLRTNAPLEPASRAAARRLDEGWIYIIDQRTETPGGEVPPEDIIAALQVSHGAIVPNSYRRNDRHRILSDRGFFRLSPGLHARLVKAMSREPVDS